MKQIDRLAAEDKLKHLICMNGLSQNDLVAHALNRIKESDDLNQTTKNMFIDE